MPNKISWNSRILLAALFLALELMLAKQSTCQPIQPGDRMPNIEAQYWKQDIIRAFNFTDLKGKLVILDFWNIWCSSCIASMPKMDSLQKKFGDAIQIILVTTNTEAEVKKVFQRPFLQQVDLPVITRDSVLSKLFPYASVPHHVWINASGVVEYITYSYNANERTISDYFAGKKPVLSYKKEQDQLEFSKPLWAKENIAFSKNIRYYSYATRWISEYGGGGISRFIDSAQSIVGIRFINTSLLSLYQVAFGGFTGGVFRYSNRVILDIPDPDLFCPPKDGYNMDGWNEKNLVCYEISIPLSQKEELFKLMQIDLDRFFGYYAKVEKKKVQCLCLVRTSAEDKMRSTHSGRRIITTDTSLVIENETIGKALLAELRIANLGLRTPIIDETGYSGKVDLLLNCSLSDIGLLRKQLRRYDLDLTMQEREIEMLVIGEKNARRDSHGRH